MKYCSKCNKSKKINEFYIYKGKIKSPCKECIKENARAYRSKIRLKIIKEKQKRSYRLNNPKKPPVPKWAQKIMVNIKKRGNSTRNIEVGKNINTRFIQDLYESQSQKCYYTGIEMIIDDPIRKPSPDRVDSLKGYTADNLVLCCTSINYAKNSFNEKDFMEFLIEIKLNEPTF